MATTSFIGLVKEVGQIEQKTEKLEKVSVIVEEISTSQWKNTYDVQGLNQMAHALVNLTPGSRVNFECEVTGRPWTSRTGDTLYFTNLKAIKYKIMGQAAPQKDPASNEPVDFPGPEYEQYEAQKDDIWNKPEYGGTPTTDEDDLPF